MEIVGRTLRARRVRDAGGLPAVPKAEVGFRVQLTAVNDDAEVDTLIAALRELPAQGELQPAREQDATRHGNGSRGHSD